MTMGPLPASTRPPPLPANLPLTRAQQRRHSRGPVAQRCHMQGRQALEDQLGRLRGAQCGLEACEVAVRDCAQQRYAPVVPFARHGCNNCVEKVWCCVAAEAKTRLACTAVNLVSPRQGYFCLCLGSAERSSPQYGVRTVHVARWRQRGMQQLHAPHAFFAAARLGRAGGILQLFTSFYTFVS